MNQERIEQLDRVLMNMAEEISTMSLATRSKVGALVFKDDRILSTGWNGMPSGMPNDQLEFVEDGILKTNPFVVHAEANSLAKCAKNGTSTIGGSMYITMSPCVECAKQIIQCGIKKVFYRTAYRDISSLDFLKNAGISVKHLPKEIS